MARIWNNFKKQTYGCFIAFGHIQISHLYIQNIEGFHEFSHQT